MIPHGVPIVSVLFHEPDSENTKLVRIGEQISNLTSTDEEEPITGYLRGIQLCPHENNMNKGHIVYDNIPTYGYVNPDCAQAIVSVEDFDVEAILLQDQDGVYHKILMENVTSIEFQNDDQTAWIEATTEDIVNYVNSVSSDAIDVISVDASTKTINATVNTTSGLDIGLLDFLTGIEGIQSVTYKVNGQTFAMTVGDETTYDPFMEGVLSNMPTSETPNVNGAMTLNAENGAQLTYTLNVTYFNQVEEFGKIDTYLDSYAGEDVTVTKSADKTYGVVGHIASAAELVFDVITAALGVKNISDITLTAGEASANGVDAATLKAFINEKIPYSDLADPVAITMAVTAGDETVSYSFTFSSDYVVDPEAIIGDVRYHTLAEALGAAKEGDTLVLQKNLTVNNAGIDGTAATPVIAIPVNMTFDGNNKTITADEASWAGTNTNHVIGASNVTATIKNLTIAGHANMKSGVVCFGQTGNVTLENVTAQNCGNCGVQVAGATVSATNLHTSGNAWGGVNVDKGSDGSTPHLTVGEGCTFGELAEVYTEITDQEVVTAASMTKYQGYGTTLKGFIYYTSDVTKFTSQGAVIYDGAIYETINDIMEQNDEVELTPEADMTQNVVVPAGKTLTLNMGNHTIANNGASDTIVNNGTMILKGTGTIDNTETNKAALTNNGHLTILGGTICRSQDTGVPDDDTHPGYYALVNHGTMVIGEEDADNSGITISSTGGYSALVENGWYDSAGKVAGEDDCHLTIYGGNFIGGKYGVKNDELGHANIYGGEFSGSSSVNVLNWHNLYIHDGTFDGTMKKQANVMNGKYNLGDGHVEISGGDFTTGFSACIIQVNGYGSNDVSLTGGVYNKKIGLASYLADGYELDEEINPGKYTVVQIEAASIGDVTYSSLAAAIEALPDGTPTTINLLEDVTENVTIPVGKNVTISGGASSATITGGLTIAAEGDADTNVTVEHINLVSPGASKTYGILSQNQSDEGQMNCNLVLNDCSITGFASKAVYGTNIKTLNLTGCRIENCATGSMDDPNTKGDYAIDLNLIAVQNAVITIDGCTFTGDLGDKAAIKITQRGGASDANASDIPKNVGEASIDSVTVKNCDFTGSTTEVDFRIGTDNKTGGDTVNTCGAFPMTIEGNNTEMVVQSAYLENEPTLTVPAGREATKAADGDIAIVLTPEEQVDAIMEDIPGATETSNNVYSIVTSNGSLENLAFLDEIAAIPGFTAMTVSDGVAAPVTFEAGGNMETFKTQVQALLPDSNEDPQVTLTLTVSVA